ncbi:EpsG family protein [Erythrobacter sp. NFXS35]|uniref:EpsG family protein n=1 Tax=Erythrobacter sp. NFXS35 TaxID=2818436 RepID=UPI0032DEDDFF
MYNRRYINNHIKPFSIIIGFAASMQLYIAYNAIGGVDINVYWLQAPHLDYAIPRYYQEPVSWGLIKFLTNLERSEFLFAFSLAVLSIAILRLGVVGGLILYASFLSPFGVMMEFNVLRQCLATVFLTFFILAILSEKRIAAATWGVLAILSHNSVLLIGGFLLFMNYYSLFSRKWKVISVLAVILLTGILQIYDGIDFILGSRVDSYSSIIRRDGLQDLIYFGFAMAFSLLLFFKTQQRKWRPISVGLAAALLFTVVVCSLLSLDTWVYGRMAMTVVVICHFLLLYDVWETRRVGLMGLLFLFSMIVINGLTILFHPGALSMVQPYGD